MSSPPSVTGISPNEGHPGTKIIIRGENLGRSQHDLLSVIINDDECIASAEWHSPNKITARCGRNQGTGPVIVSTRSSGRGTCTVSFRIYTTRIGLTTEVGYWYDEAKQWEARRGRIMFVSDATTNTAGTLAATASDAVHRSSVIDDANPLGLDDPGEVVFDEEQLTNMFPETCGDLNLENFSPAWYILQHHSTASLRDLERALRLREERKRRERETSTNDMVLYVKDFLVSFFECVDTLDHLDARIGDDRRKLGDAIGGLTQMCTKMEQDIKGTFGEIFARRRSIEELKLVSAVVSKYAYLWSTLANINRARHNKNFALIITETRKLKTLLEQVPASVFKQMMHVISGDIEKLNQNLHDQLLSPTTAMPGLPDEQILVSKLLRELGVTLQDPLWACIKQLHAFTMDQMRLFFVNQGAFFFHQPVSTSLEKNEAARSVADFMPELPKLSAYLTRKAYFEQHSVRLVSAATSEPQSDANIKHTNMSSLFDKLITSFVDADLGLIQQQQNNNSTNNFTVIRSQQHTDQSQAAANNSSELLLAFMRLPVLVGEWTRAVFDLAVKRCEHLSRLWARCNHRQAALDEHIDAGELQKRFHTLLEAVVCQACITVESLLRYAIKSYMQQATTSADISGETDKLGTLRLKTRHLVVLMSGAQKAVEQLTELSSSAGTLTQFNDNVGGDNLTTPRRPPSSYSAGPYYGGLQHLRYFTRGAGLAIVCSVLRQAKEDARLCCLTALVNTKALALLPRLYQTLLHKVALSLALINDNDNNNNSVANNNQPDQQQQQLRCFNRATAELISASLHTIMEMPLAVLDESNWRDSPAGDDEAGGSGDFGALSSTTSSERISYVQMLLSILALLKLRYSIIPAMLSMLQTDALLSNEFLHQLELQIFQRYGEKQNALTSLFIEATVQELFVRELRVKMETLSLMHHGDLWSPPSSHASSSSSSPSKADISLDSVQHAPKTSPGRECFVAFLMRLLQRMNNVTAIVSNNALGEEDATSGRSEKNVGSDNLAAEGGAAPFRGVYAAQSRDIIETFVHDYCQALAVSLATELNRYIRSDRAYNSRQSAAALGCIYIIQNSLQRFLSDDGHFLLNAASEWVLECLERSVSSSSKLNGGNKRGDEQENVKAGVVRAVKQDVDEFFTKNAVLQCLSMLAEQKELDDGDAGNTA